MTTSPKAQQLLDAQVAWLIAEVTDRVAVTVARDVDALLDVGTRLTLGDLVDATAIKALVRTLAETVPPSTAASTLVAMAADVAHAGPGRTFTLAEVVDRENVERITDEVLAGADTLGRALDDLTQSPLVTTLASRFVSKVVADVLATNRAVAEKIPGVGGLVGLGAGAAGKVAGKVVGAADKQFEAVLGDTAAKGAAFAMRRLNRIVVEILKDPTTRAAVLEVFDLYADQDVPALAELLSQDDVHRIAELIQDVVIAGAPTEPVLLLADALVDGLLASYGEHPASTLVAELGIERDLIVGVATVAVARVVAAARESGDLERLLRERLEPFYSSPEVAAILG